MSPAIEQQIVDRFREIVARRFGLNLENGHRDRLVEALQRGVDRSGQGDPALYVQRFEDGACSRSELSDLVEDLTVAETYFFRHPDQFRATSDRAVLERLRGEANIRRLRMLSAGCASGEEAFSLAILARENVPSNCGLNVSVLGIDINANVLEKARKARYTPWSLRGVPDDVRQRHFRTVGNDFVLNDSVRELVKFVECNLLDEDDSFWQPDTFDVIFCRNVIMYLTPDAGRTLLGRLTRSLSPGGFLFLGPVETLRGISHDFHLQHSHETFYYQSRLPGERSKRHAADGCRPIPFVEPPLPVTMTGDQSWVSTICHASERVAALSRRALATESRGRLPGNETSGHRADMLPIASSPALDLARRFVREERFDEALRVLAALPGNEGQNPDVQLLCAAVLTNAGRVREADQICRAVLAHDELNAEAHYLLALCREHSGELAAAIEQDEMAIYLDPQFAMPHLHLGLLARRVGDRAAARRAFEAASLLIAREDASRIVLLGGGFGREALAQLCHAELRSNGTAP